MVKEAFYKWWDGNDSDAVRILFQQDDAWPIWEAAWKAANSVQLPLSKIAAIERKYACYVSNEGVSAIRAELRQLSDS